MEILGAGPSSGTGNHDVQNVSVNPAPTNTAHPTLHPVSPPINAGQPVDPAPEASQPKKSSRKLLRTVIVILLLLIAGGAVWWYFGMHNSKTKLSVTSSVKVPHAIPSAAVISSAKGQKLTFSKAYGDKYASGILPVGDGKYTTSAPKPGYIYACKQYAQNLAADSGGAQTRGSWFMHNNTEYDVRNKLHVQGNVMWKADFSDKISGGMRTIVTNDLPNHPTGIFPIQPSDQAYQYDRNPNSIKGQTMTFALNADPTYSSTPKCMGGEVGIMLTGVALYSAFDAGGRDAGAWEVQDACQGHPQKDGIYHYHTLSSCIKNVSQKTVIGFALDGFPITGPRVGGKNILTTADLDVCHGIVSQIDLDGRDLVLYHYVMTQDFPYSISCFRGKPISPPGMQPQSTPPAGAAKLTPPPRR